MSLEARDLDDDLRRGTLENRLVEWVDRLHEHCKEPAVVRDGRYVLPFAPGYSIELLPVEEA